MQADRIRAILARNPHWGPQTVATALRTTPGTIRQVASREQIKFMDRYDVESYADMLKARLEAGDGQTV
jgi:hypothetical protein